jgi:hypothetical protein
MEEQVKKEWGSKSHLFKLLEEKITSMEFARKDWVVAQRIYQKAIREGKGQWVEMFKC